MLLSHSVGASLQCNVGSIHGTDASLQTSLLEFILLDNGCGNVSGGIDMKVEKHCASPFNELMKEWTNNLFADCCVFCQVK